MWNHKRRTGALALLLGSSIAASAFAASPSLLPAAAGTMAMVAPSITNDEEQWLASQDEIYAAVFGTAWTEETAFLSLTGPAHADDVVVAGARFGTTQTFQFEVVFASSIDWRPDLGPADYTAAVAQSQIVGSIVKGWMTGPAGRMPVSALALTMTIDGSTYHTLVPGFLLTTESINRWHFIADFPPEPPPTCPNTDAEYVLCTGLSDTYFQNRREAFRRSQRRVGITAGLAVAGCIGGNIVLPGSFVVCAKVVGPAILGAMLCMDEAGADIYEDWSNQHACCCAAAGLRAIGDPNPPTITDCVPLPDDIVCGFGL
jgi:hypothetical protein